jgi:hypothetical protein
MGHIKGEVITAREALARVGLEDLATEWEADRLVEWTGYPKPFACGHTAEYGYGPAQDGVEPARDGSHRMYKGLHRVSQHFASGPVLFCWSRIGKSSNGGGHYHLCGGLVVSVVELEGSTASTALRIGWTA